VLPQRNQVLRKPKQMVKKLLRSGKQFGTYFPFQSNHDIVPKVALPSKANIFKKKEVPAKESVKKAKVHTSLLDSP